uniref:Uncharacterized protein n=1 Tax=Piliocolobus tephrosceles TaxID=591936 RepID=A0A8C9GU07_9PRIM
MEETAVDCFRTLPSNSSTYPTMLLCLLRLFSMTRPLRIIPYPIFIWTKEKPEHRDHR